MRHWNIGLIIQQPKRGTLVQKLIPFAQHTQCDRKHENEIEKKITSIVTAAKDGKDYP